MKAVFEKKFQGGKKVIKVTIRLDDPCKNGHDDFSITSDIGCKGRGRDRFEAMGESWVFESGGCNHDDILKHFPEFDIFADLHLSNRLGEPMYAVANGFYHLKNSPRATTINYLRINNEQYDELFLAEDKEYFQYLLHKLEIPKFWKKQADIAIAKLEGVTKEKYTPREVETGHMTPLTDDKIKEIEKRVKDGYYTPEAIQNREEVRIADAMKAQIDAVYSEYEREVEKASNEKDVKIALIQAGCPKGTYIYYTHSNEVSFNWSTDKLTDEQIERIKDKIDMESLPEGIKFTIKVHHHVG